MVVPPLAELGSAYRLRDGMTSHTPMRGLCYFSPAAVTGTEMVCFS